MNASERFGLGPTGAGGGGNKNVIINGDMRIAQRGVSFPAIVGYNLDRWHRGVSGTAVHTITQDSDGPNDQFNSSMKIDCTTADAATAAGDLVSIQQPIEGYNFKRLVGKTATFSFWVKAGKTGTMCIAFRSGGFDRSYVAEITIDAANTWEKKTVTLTFDATGGTWDYTNGRGLWVSFLLMCGTTYQTTADAWQTGQFFATANQTNFCDNADATCDVFITGVQLELGATSSDFEFLNYGDELAQCQRYYYSMRGESSFTWLGAGHSPTTVLAYIVIPFPVSMRAAPSLSYSSASDFGVQNGGGGNATPTSIVISGPSKTGCGLSVNTSSLASQNPTCLTAVNTNARLNFDAEL